MNRLHEIQRCFADTVLLNPAATEASAAAIRANGLKPEQRLAIYRNNTHLGLTDALRGCYPVIYKLVGQDFFIRLAGDYIRQHPPAAGSLLTFGGRLAEFVADYQAVESLPYLADTAMLEWLWHEAFHEADGNNLNASLLANIDSSLYGKLGFILHPSARFLISDFPLLAIWQLNQQDWPADARITLDQGGCRLLIFRSGLEVQIVPLAQSEYLLLSSLASGLTLTQSVYQSRAGDTGLDLAATLQRWLETGLIIDFFIS